MSVALRDVRVLADLLAAHDDWDVGGHAYAAEHDRAYGAVRTADNWFSEMFMAVGDAAEERRAAALPLIAGDPSRMVDVGMSGPDTPVDDSARRRFFGLD
jgi:2-polyprenyl-6-methoxyphenol hydroxylase-like FAD-dependent oxidoreductase